jgi:transcriptional regulator with XRE-family HTH domain
VGARLRAARQAGGLTLQQVAHKSGLTPSAISQIERGLSNPSVGTLKALADALGTSLGALFNSDRRETRRSILVHEGTRKVLSPAPGITCHLLTENLSGKIQFMLTVYAPGVSTGDRLSSHEGEECALILGGTMELHLGRDTYILKEGDSIRFERSTPHRVTNIGGRPLRAIWAITPPSF